MIHIIYQAPVTAKGGFKRGGGGRLQLTLATAHAYISALQIFELISYHTIYIYHIYQALTTTGGAQGRLLAPADW